MPASPQAAFPILTYPDPRAAIAWLERALGAEAVAVHPPDPAEPLVHAEVRVGEGLVMLDLRGRDAGGPLAASGPVALYAVVGDPDALHDRARAAGAEIVIGLTDQPSGSREFACRDIGGNLWYFGTSRPGGSS